MRGMRRSRVFLFLFSGRGAGCVCVSEAFWGSFYSLVRVWKSVVLQSIVAYETMDNTSPD